MAIIPSEFRVRMYVASLPLLRLAINDLVELAGTSEDLAIATSFFFTIIGSGEFVGALDGDGVADGAGDALAEAVGTSFPESHMRIVFPLLFPLTHV
jgi:hypothetical protein